MSEPGSSSSRSIPFKSKKRLMDSPSSKSKPENLNSSSVALPTPEKLPENIFTRSRNRSVALSVKVIRQAAGSCLRSEDPVGKVSSAKNKLVFSTNDSSSSASQSSYRRSTKFWGSSSMPLDSSILLSRLRGSRPTFLNIS